MTQSRKREAKGHSIRACGQTSGTATQVVDEFWCWNRNRAVCETVSIMADDNSSNTAKPGVKDEAISAAPTVSLKSFLEDTPPGRSVGTDGVVQTSGFSPPRFHLELPVLGLHCGICGGIRSFEGGRPDGDIHQGGYRYGVQLKFTCRNCKRSLKRYSLLVFDENDAWKIYKLGELPEFGPPTPSKLISLIRDERDHYLKGRRSENQGLGIAAFAYYRRVVENQKERIFAEVIRASKKVNAPEKMISELEAARKETQFSKAIETINPGVPEALLMDGHNPLMLLHNALSEGLHAQTDEECLELATSIRVVLTDLVERMASVLADHAELKTAVKKLIEVKTKKIKATKAETAR